MGCCASTKNPSSDPPFQLPKSNRHSPPSSPCPLPLIEEESIKELLSETPTPKLKIPKIEEEPKNTLPKQRISLSISRLIFSFYLLASIHTQTEDFGDEGFSFPFLLVAEMRGGDGRRRRRRRKRISSNSSDEEAAAARRRKEEEKKEKKRKGKREKKEEKKRKEKKREKKKKAN
ncbi:hypothetical protein LguiB_029102 [Lonicera macranthoides]